MLGAARLDFLRQVLPLARDDEDFKFARALAEAIGEITFDEAVAGFKAELKRKAAFPSAASERG